MVKNTFVPHRGKPDARVVASRSAPPRMCEIEAVDADKERKYTCVVCGIPMAQAAIASSASASRLSAGVFLLPFPLFLLIFLARSLMLSSISLAIQYAFVCEAVEESMALYARRHRGWLDFLLPPPLPPSVVPPSSRGAPVLSHDVVCGALVVM